MDITLHIGAHRTGTTCFQKYMRQSRNELHKQNIEFWGPGRTRRGMLSGLYEHLNGRTQQFDEREASVRLDVQLERIRASGVRHLLVSEENLMGSIRKNVKAAVLYPQVGQRVSCFAEGFGAEVKTILISIRSLDAFWCSSLAYAVAKNLTAPDPQICAMIARGRRGWRDVITEIAHALPGVDLRVLPFETFVGRPDQFLVQGTGIDGPVCEDRSPINVSPTLPELRRAIHANGKDTKLLPLGRGRWNPFTNEEHSTLRKLFADDMMWLTTGADGLAELIEDGGTTKSGPNPSRAAKKKGQFDEFEKRRMARPS